MGKQGPCYHCGVTNTPLWRNGPPEKPVLCNACGSRWRTKGTLTNYTPLHARADVDDYEDNRATRMKNMSINKSKEVKQLKRKPNHDSGVVGVVNPDYNQGYQKALDEDTSNRSSSGSAISNSESCAQCGSGDASDLTGQAQSIVWDAMVPSKKRTCVNRPKQSPVEKLAKDLHTILYEQQSSCVSGSCVEDLLLESETPMFSVEIGHGSVLIRNPSSVARDEESEASSLSVENKQYSTNEAYSHFMSHPIYSESKSISRAYSVVGKYTSPFELGMQLEELKRDKPLPEKFQIRGNLVSILCNVDLNDILTFEEFSRNLSTEEQQQLLKYLPPVDTAKLPDSLKNMFDSPQFKEDMDVYQQMLAEGVFDLSLSGAKPEDCMAVKMLALSNLSKSKWVESYRELKKCTVGSVKLLVAKEPNGIARNSYTAVKKECEKLILKLPEGIAIKSPKRFVTKATYENKDLVDNDGSCFSPRSLFTMPPDGGSLMLDSLPFVDANSDQDLLLDVPSNGSFPQAELLHPTVNFGLQASISSSSVYPRLVGP
ncbi:hypothetical protein K2173_002744 [Erythroxylum novogranatense]|uniref:GATA transcription factor n=1 Tax=Erythroxylum novogranatense TaxID=1862640 RepID=A0AAV8SQP1_9ROSI|nr:hypothetical protein K2173_002744 [Erythroxylum novogranatense]